MSRQGNWQHRPESDLVKHQCTCKSPCKKNVFHALPSSGREADMQVVWTFIPKPLSFLLCSFQCLYRFLHLPFNTLRNVFPHSTHRIFRWSFGIPQWYVFIMLSKFLAWPRLQFAGQKANICTFLTPYDSHRDSHLLQPFCISSFEIFPIDLLI